MLTVTADDLGMTREATDAALRCFRPGGITSASAMVFMDDSERAAEQSLAAGLPVGLHLNLSAPYAAGASIPLPLREAHERIGRFLRSGRYALLLYHPGLRTSFRAVVEAQWAEFLRLFGKPPAHVDGHQHLHLCANVLLDGLLPAGVRVRRNFSFAPGEKGWLNRAYRRRVDARLARRFQVTDYFFCLGQCLRNGSLPRVLALARGASVELMTHPARPEESECLLRGLSSAAGTCPAA